MLYSEMLTLTKYMPQLRKTQWNISDVFYKQFFCKTQGNVVEGAMKGGDHAQTGTYKNRYLVLLTSWDGSTVFKHKEIFLSVIKHKEIFSIWV